ncbi:hypothetical protein JOM56_009177 [Amanita muscaria]
MPAPAGLVVAATITAFVTGYVFIRFVYEPHIAPTLERFAEDFLEHRRARSRRLASPVDAAHPPPGGDDRDDIPLNNRRRTRSDESGDEESAPLLGSTTVREEPNMNENVNVNATLRRRPVPAVSNGHSAPLLGARGSTIESSVNENVNSMPTLPRRPVNNRLFASEHHHQVTAQDNGLRLQPTATALSPSGVSPSDVDGWRRTVHEERRRPGQGQPMRLAVDRRPLPSPLPFVPHPTGYPILDEEPVDRLPLPSTVPAVPFVPNLDEPTLPLPIYPTHVITDSSVPSTPSSTTSGGRNVMFTPPPQLSPLRSSTISTNAGAPSEISVLDPWNGVFSTQDGGLASVPSVAQSTTTASFQTDGRSSTSQLLVSPPNSSGARAPPQLPPFSPLSSMHASARPTPVKSPQLPALRSPPPQTPRTPPYLLTPSAQHPHHVHYPAPANIASSPVRGPATTALAAPTQAPISPILSLSQSYPVSLDQDQGIAVIFDPTPPASPFQSPTFSDPFDIVVPGSPGPFGSPGLQGSPQSPFIPLSIPPLPISPPGANRTQRQPLDLLGSAGSVTTTIRHSSSLNPPPQSPSTSTSMFYSFTNDTARQTFPPARPPPAMQSGGMLSFPPEANHNQQQQQQPKFASPGVMSPMLSELDFVSEFGGSELGSNDDIGSESSWSSARF